MTCERPEIVALLSDFHAGLLDAARRAEVQSHVDACAECRECLKAMDALIQRLEDSRPGDGDNHIPAAVLAQYYTRSDHLDASARQRVRDHLESCEACAAELEFLTAMEDDLSTVSQAHSATPAASEHTSRTVWIWIAAAAALVLGFGWLYQHQVLDDSAATGDETVFVLSDMTRGSGARTIVTRTDAKAAVRIDVPFYHDRDRFRYRFAVLPGMDAQPLDAVIEADMSERGVIHLRLRTAHLADAQYILMVSEIPSDPDTEGTTLHLQFQLVTAE